MLDLICVEKCRGCGVYIRWSDTGPVTLCATCWQFINPNLIVETSGEIIVSYLLDYDNPTVKHMIRQLKYAHDCLIARDLSLLLQPACEYFFDVLDMAPYVVPVPLHWSRKLLRGYNQSELIAEPICESFGWPNGAQLLRRHRKTKAHHGLDREQRSTNVEQAFKAAQASDPDRPILLIDDVFTSGATLWECARTLRKAGYKAVFALTAARAP
jgi:competence protein ComFC